MVKKKIQAQVRDVSRGQTDVTGMSFCGGCNALLWCSEGDAENEGSHPSATVPSTAIWGTWASASLREEDSHTRLVMSVEPVKAGRM